MNPFLYLCTIKIKIKQTKKMKLTVGDYLIGLLISLPLFGAVIFGLTAWSDLSDSSIYVISIILTILDYSNYLMSIRKDKIIEQLQNRVKNLEEQNKNKK